MFQRQHCTLLVATAIVAVHPSAQAITIDEDTVLDASNSSLETTVDIVDGTDGPTTVRIVEGGITARFHVLENSTMILDGGTTGDIGSIRDNGTLIVNSGELSCLTRLCMVSGPPAILIAEDSARLHFFGGRPIGNIFLEDSSVAHFWGLDLMVERTLPVRRVYELSGTFANGDPAAVHFQLFDDAQFFIHVIPEPTTALMLLWGLLLLGRHVLRRVR